VPLSRFDAAPDLARKMMQVPAVLALAMQHFLNRKKRTPPYWTWLKLMKGKLVDFF
jgi:hypothetical protein